jgi:sugar/nucleoside kinase (ribokinase family)
MGRALEVNRLLHYDYTAIGHVTNDVLDDGTRRPGGALYGALQAARLGLRTLLITRGAARELDALLAPYRHELDVQVLDAPHTTTLLTTGRGAERTQRMLAWAGAIAWRPALDTAILHLAPVARESPERWRGSPAFLGLTPQGLARDWSGDGAEIVQVAPDRAAEELARRCRAVVLSDSERASCAGLIAAAGEAGALVAVTAGARPTVLLEPGGRERELDVPALEDAVDDIGAGDVFAAAWFVALHEGRPAMEAAAFATAAAAVRMRGTGAGAIGARAEIEARLRLGAPGR